MNDNNKKQNLTHAWSHTQNSTIHHNITQQNLSIVQPSSINKQEMNSLIERRKNQLNLILNWTKGSPVAMATVPSESFSLPTASCVRTPSGSSSSTNSSSAEFSSHRDTMAEMSTVTSKMDTLTTEKAFDDSLSVNLVAKTNVVDGCSASEPACQYAMAVSAVGSLSPSSFDRIDSSSHSSIFDSLNDDRSALTNISKNPKVIHGGPIDSGIT